MSHDGNRDHATDDLWDEMLLWQDAAVLFQDYPPELGRISEDEMSWVRLRAEQAERHALEGDQGGE